MQNRIERFEARITADQKELFLKASTLGGHKSLSDFIVSSAQEKANNIIAEQQVIQLSKEERTLFVDALLNPPSPNQKLKKAAKKFSDS